MSASMSADATITARSRGAPEATSRRSAKAVSSPAVTAANPLMMETPGKR